MNRAGSRPSARSQISLRVDPELGHLAIRHPRPLRRRALRSARPESPASSCKATSSPPSVRATESRWVAATVVATLRKVAHRRDGSEPNGRCSPRRSSCGLSADQSPLESAFLRVRGLVRRGWSIGRVLFPGVLRRTVRRPSISGRRCRRPRAVHPRTRAGSPRACAVRPCSGRGLPSRSGRPDRWWSLAPPFHPYLKRALGGLFSVALSRGLPRVGVAHRPALRSPDLPRRPRCDRVRRGRPTNPSALVSVGVGSVISTSSTNE